jgi:nucleoside-diphosphate-sugar epimerase
MNQQSSSSPLGGRHYLVTGATGFIGSALVRALVKNGNRVRALDDESRGSRLRLSDIASEIDWAQGDVRDAGTVARAVRGVDAVCHLAAVNGTEFFYSRPDLVLEVAVKGMINVLDACIAHGVGELFVASSSEVYQTPPKIPTDETVPLSIPDPLNPRYSYGGGKIISELLTINYGRKKLKRAVIFRPHNVYGPDMGWEHVVPQFALRMHALCQQTQGTVMFPIQGAGDETRSFVFIDDMIAGLMTLIEKGEHLGIYHIGTEEETTIKQLAEEVANCFDREIQIVPGELRAGGTLRRSPGIKKIRALGYAPAVSLKEGVAATVRWYIENADRKPNRTS